jgi:LmbE family N-acetylglucosaminyl deacetylase
MNVLAIGSHPDDIEYGCGGALLRLARKGCGVYLFIATGGEAGGDIQTRRSEQEQSVKLLGAKQVFWGGYADTQVPMRKELISKLESAIASVRPSLIFGHAPHDTHQDHRVLSDATLSATRYTQNVLLYEVPSTHDFMPTLFVDIGDTLDDKLNLLRAHQSQLDKTKIAELDILTIASSNANFRGIQARLKYAEGFLPVRFVVEP